jgi:DNA-binding transcriptional MerR regulator
MVFTLAEVAKILEMPTARVKNWVVGRPLKIVPSVKSAEGTGSRNLFGVGDLYLMALVNELWKSGMTAKAIQRILDIPGVDSKYFEKPNLEELILHMRGHKTHIEAVYRMGGKAVNEKPSNEYVQHRVRISAIKAFVDERTSEHLRR